MHDITTFNSALAIAFKALLNMVWILEIEPKIEKDPFTVLIHRATSWISSSPPAAPDQVIMVDGPSIFFDDFTGSPHMLLGSAVCDGPTVNFKPLQNNVYLGFEGQEGKRIVEADAATLFESYKLHRVAFDKIAATDDIIKFLKRFKVSYTVRKVRNVYIVRRQTV